MRSIVYILWELLTNYHEVRSRRMLVQSSAIHRGPLSSDCILLSRHVMVVLGSDYRICQSSQRSACCHNTLSNRSSTKRATAKHCTTCRRLLSRDASSACIVLDIFEHQRTHQTKELHGGGISLHSFLSTFF